jgi:hypothetical protein
MRVLLGALVVALARGVAAAPNHMDPLHWLYGNFSHGYDISVNRNIPQGIFDASVGGTIIPLGTYADFDDVIDYFYGQAAPFKPPPGFVIPPTQYYIREYVEDRSLVAATVDVVIPRGANAVLGDPATMTNFTFTGFYEFTNNTKSATIKRFNLVIPRGSEFFRASYANSFGYYGSSTWRDFVINVTCDRHEANCGNSRQYSNKQACVDFMKSVEFGLAEYAYENTAMCRYIHSAMTAARPEIHCEHVGPTGGMFCTGKRSYSEFYGQTFTAPMRLE